MIERTNLDMTDAALRAILNELGDGIKSSIDRLAQEVGNLRVDAAVQKQQIARIEAGFEKAAAERSTIAKEVGAQNIAITGFTGRLAGVETALAELRPQVSGLTHDRVMVEGGVKAASLAFSGGSKIVAVLWGLATVVLALATFLGGVWMQRMTNNTERDGQQQSPPQQQRKF